MMPAHAEAASPQGNLMLPPMYAELTMTKLLLLIRCQWRWY